MPLDERDLLEVQQIARTYSDAEVRILMRITAALSKGLEAPTWETDALSRLQRLREEAVADLAGVDAGQAAMIEARLAALYGTGGRDVLRDIGADLTPERISSTQQRRAVKALAAEVTGAISGAVNTMLRATDDAYRSVVADVVQSVVARGESKRDALTRAVREFFGKGLPSFTDKGGRRWNIQDYTNMAVRTGYAAAQIRGHEDAIAEAGLDLVIVQPGPRACSICDRWARSILIVSGSAGTYWRDNELTGKGMSVKVDGSLAEARAAGFQHPNCRCSIRAYVPGVTDPKTIERPPWDAEGYERQQQQRGLERRVRGAKVELANAQASGDPKAIAQAKRRLAAQQGALRDHLSANPYLKRRSDREQVLRPGDGGVPEGGKRKPTAPAPEPEQTARMADAAQREAQRADERVERPEAERTLMQRFLRRETPEPLSDIARVVNPGGDSKIDRNYLMNCHYVVGATEMRARGYDVVARPTVAGMGRYDQQIERDWIGGKFSYLRDAPKDARGLRIGGGGPLEWIDRETAGMPVGARGYVTGAWARGGGGHIWTWEKTAAGIVYHEGQIRDTGSDLARVNVTRLDSKTIAIMRVDDLEPAPGIVSTVQSPDEFALDGERRLRNEIARLEETRDALAAQLVEEERAVDEYREIVDAYREWEKVRRESRARKTPTARKIELIAEANRLSRIWSADRAAAQRGVNLDQVAKGTRDRMAKIKTEINRLKRELKAMGA